MKYRVCAKTIIDCYFDVEAESEDAALEKADEACMEGLFDENPFGGDFQITDCYEYDSLSDITKKFLPWNGKITESEDNEMNYTNFMEYIYVWSGQQLKAKDMTLDEKRIVKAIDNNEFTERVSLIEYDDIPGISIYYPFDIDWLNKVEIMAAEFESICADFFRSHPVTPNSKWIYDDDYNDGIYLFIPLDDIKINAGTDYIGWINTVAKNNLPYQYVEDYCSE